MHIVKVTIMYIVQYTLYIKSTFDAAQLIANPFTIPMHKLKSVFKRSSFPSPQVDYAPHHDKDDR